ncbi:unnamed protein product [Didymodactylos carnosus]|uniref:Uncharacterized protein n=1 Tax=Didymodactylos carnosus TaxID=1234261 RepID=A0A814W4R1_9BILA|nr:unnamed protein product [Didymodactylos carnosus]CAF3964623.1 unnamed protein product [Didymodactylos carnosus]
MSYPFRSWDVDPEQEELGQYFENDPSRILEENFRADLPDFATDERDSESLDLKRKYDKQNLFNVKCT